jgi:hypothetical protein
MQGDYYLSLRLKKERVLELGSEEEFFEKEYFSKCDPQACKL